MIQSDSLLTERRKAVLVAQLMEGNRFMFHTDGEIAFEDAVRHAERSGVSIEGFLAGDEADITALEARLSVRFPPSYKAMVRRYGTVVFDSAEIYGLTKTTGFDAEGVPNVVFTTEDARRRGMIGNGMILFMASGYGPLFLLDCNETDEFGEAPVYEISAGGMAFGREKRSSSFGHFILSKVEGLSES